MELRGPGPPREIAQRYLGNRIAVSGDDLVLDEIDVVRSVAFKSDLYLVDPENGARRRLTREARAADPDVSSTGEVVCTVQFSDRRALATFRLPGCRCRSRATDSDQRSVDRLWIAALGAGRQAHRRRTPAGRGRLADRRHRSVRSDGSRRGRLARRPQWCSILDAGWQANRVLVRSGWRAVSHLLGRRRVRSGRETRGHRRECAIARCLAGRTIDRVRRLHARRLRPVFDSPDRRSLDSFRAIRVTRRERALCCEPAGRRRHWPHLFRVADAAATLLDADR